MGAEELRRPQLGGPEQSRAGQDPPLPETWKAWAPTPGGRHDEAPSPSADCGNEAPGEGGLRSWARAGCWQQSPTTARAPQTERRTSWHWGWRECQGKRSAGCASLEMTGGSWESGGNRSWGSPGKSPGAWTAPLPSSGPQLPCSPEQGWGGPARRRDERTSVCRGHDADEYWWCKYNKHTASADRRHVPRQSAGRARDAHAGRTPLHTQGRSRCSRPRSP